MRKTFDNIIINFNEGSLLIEDIMNNMVDTPKNYKLKKKVEAWHKSFRQALDRHEDVISDSIPAIKVKMNDYSEDFIETWKTYKDFLIEQFGIRMQSRMQKYRLELLFEMTEKDVKKATRWLQYYMAAGSSNIYPVNELKIEEKQDGKTEQRKAGFSIAELAGKNQRKN